MKGGIRTCCRCHKALGPSSFPDEGSERKTHTCFACHDKIKQQRFLRQMNRSHIDAKLANTAATRAVGKLKQMHYDDFLDLIDTERAKLGLPISNRKKYPGRPSKVNET